MREKRILRKIRKPMEEIKEMTDKTR